MVGLPDEVMVAALTLVAVLQLGALALGSPVARNAHCYVLVAIVAAGAYAAHVRQLRKLGYYNSDSDEDSRS